MKRRPENAPNLKATRVFIDETAVNLSAVNQKAFL